MLKITPGLRQFLLLVCGGAALLSVSACEVIFPPPTSPYVMRIQTLENTSIPGQSRVHVFSGTVHAHFVELMPDSVNTGGHTFANIQTGGDGLGFAENMILNARYNFQSSVDRVSVSG